MKKLVLSLAFFVLLWGVAFAEERALAEVEDSQGSGFFVAENGLLITCAHVIEDAKRVKVVINPGPNERVFDAEVLKENTASDLAVLKINYQNRYHFKVSDFTATNLGDPLSVLGFPLVNQPLTEDIRYTTGTLSARSGLKREAIYFQHSASTQPGNSGGPIFNGRYEVIGVAGAIDPEYHSINYGIKSGYIFPMFDTIKLGNGNITSISDGEQATVLIRCYYTAAAPPSIVMTFTNRTGYNGLNLFINPSLSDTWGPNRLGTSSLDNGQSITVRVPISEDGRYDIRMVDTDEDPYTRWRVPVSSGQNVVFTMDDFGDGNDDDDDDEGPPVEGAAINFTFGNNTGYEGLYLYVKPSSSDTWGPDRLGNSYLASGESITVRVPASEDGRYDIRLVDTDEDSYTRWRVPVMAHHTVEFTFDDFDEDDDFEEPLPGYDGPPVTIVNDTGITIYYLYISPSSSESWGDDRLGDDVLMDGDSVSFRLPYPLSEGDRYDFMAEDSKGEVYTKFNRTMQANGRITFVSGDME